MKRTKFDAGFLAGILAVLFWAAAPTTRRCLSESLSPFISGGTAFVLSGTIMWIMQLKKGGFVKLKDMDRRYPVYCAIPYFIYALSSFFCSALASTREASVLANLFNSLWALGNLVFTVIILKKKTNKAFPFACFLSVAGAAFGALAGSSVGIKGLTAGDIAAIVCGMMVPLSRGTYVACYCLLVKKKEEDYLPFLVIMTGVFQLVMALVTGAKPSYVNWSTLLWLILQVGMVDIGANLLWFYAMRSESRMGVLLISNMAPFLTTVVSGILMGINVKWQVYVGAAAIAIATLWAKKSLVDEEKQ